MEGTGGPTTRVLRRSPRRRQLEEYILLSPPPDKTRRSSYDGAEPSATLTTRSGKVRQGKEECASSTTPPEETNSVKAPKTPGGKVKGRRGRRAKKAVPEVSQSMEGGASTQPFISGSESPLDAASDRSAGNADGPAAAGKPDPFPARQQPRVISRMTQTDEELNVVSSATRGGGPAEQAAAVTAPAPLQPPKNMAVPLGLPPILSQALLVNPPVAQGRPRPSTSTEGAPPNVAADLAPRPLAPNRPDLATQGPPKQGLILQKTSPLQELLSQNPSLQTSTPQGTPQQQGALLNGGSPLGPPSKPPLPPAAPPLRPAAPPLRPAAPPLRPAAPPLRPAAPPLRPAAPPLRPAAPPQGIPIQDQLPPAPPAPGAEGDSGRDKLDTLLGDILISPSPFRLLDFMDVMDDVDLLSLFE